MGNSDSNSNGNNNSIINSNSNSNSNSNGNSNNITIYIYIGFPTIRESRLVALGTIRITVVGARKWGPPMFGNCPMSHSLNSLKRAYIGNNIGGYYRGY